MFCPDIDSHEKSGKLVYWKELFLKLAIQFKHYWDKEQADSMTA